MPVGLLIGGGVGLLKGLTLDRAKADRERKLAAETARYSPWTGMKPQAVEESDPLGSALQFGATGASLASGIKNAAATTGWLNRNGSPLVTAATNATQGSTPWSSGMMANDIAKKWFT